MEESRVYEVRDVTDGEPFFTMGKVIYEVRDVSDEELYHRVISVDDYKKLIKDIKAKPENYISDYSLDGMHAVGEIFYIEVRKIVLNSFSSDVLMVSFMITRAAEDKFTIKFTIKYE